MVGTGKHLQGVMKYMTFAKELTFLRVFLTARNLPVTEAKGHATGIHNTSPSNFYCWEQVLWMPAVNAWHDFIFQWLYILTCSKPSPHPQTLGAAHCRHNVVVGGVPFELLSEGDDGLSTQSGGSAIVDQIGVEWVCTIFNGTIINWLI